MENPKKEIDRVKRWLRHEEQKWCRDFATFTVYERDGEINIDCNLNDNYSYDDVESFEVNLQHDIDDAGIDVNIFII